MQESSRGADHGSDLRLHVSLYAGNCLEHVYTLLIGYRSGGTPGFPQNLRARNGICGPSTREQCLPAPQQPPGSSCCPSLLAGGFRPTTGCGLIGPASSTRSTRAKWASSSSFHEAATTRGPTASPTIGRPRRLATSCSVGVISPHGRWNMC